jgi:hypothetical protein
MPPKPNTNTLPKWSKREQIIQLLKGEPNLLSLTCSFHARLADANLKRDISSKRTLAERQMDALGRLLTGDETCAAVAVDSEKVYVASNWTGHSTETISAQIIQLRVKQGSTKLKQKFIITLRFKTRLREFTLDTQEISYDYVKRPLAHASALENEFFTLAPTNDKIISFNLPYTGSNHAHNIDDFPYPITFSFNLGDIPGIDISTVLPHDLVLRTPQDFGALNFEFTLDPLKRRANTVFSHMGLIAAYHLRNCPQLKYPFEEVLNRHRINIVQQTLYWEAPSTKSYGKSLREYQLPPNISAAAKKQWQDRRNKLLTIHTFIEQMTEDFLQYLKLPLKLKNFSISRLPQERQHYLASHFSLYAPGLSINTIVKKWVDTRLVKLATRQLAVSPTLINQSGEALIHKIGQYFIDILTLEKFFIHEAQHNTQLAKVIASIGLNHETEAPVEQIKRVNPFFIPGAEIIIVDNLLQGAHAELRLFEHLKANRRLQQGIKLPYFGISMLCCATCHLFLRAHGVDYVEGKRYRAGTHAKHYPDWVFDQRLSTEEYLAPFLGEDNCYRQYKALGGSCNFNNQLIPRQTCFLRIIENLGTLETKDFKELNFPYPKKIWSLGDNYTRDTDSEAQKLLYLEALIEHCLAVTPVVQHGAYAGYLPRNLRDMIDIIEKIKANYYSLREGLTLLANLAKTMGPQHPIYRAAKECLIVGENNIFYIEVFSSTNSTA